ncbi:MULTISPECIES: DUF418 domain-containing protein [Niastella]|uniref:DUF418 domain-containing protein n=1 Tax=Niastella soli TaxID=2821487 RepID=A0ABS3YYI3_9BACT|nr:DUF418 domain-containing protein [Niastella soli]MBO9202798.1 DUF418 domain-containing protein [Niastella soli]
MLTSTPVSYHTPSQRIALLDMMRGICLLGILLANIQTYTPFEFISSKEAVALHWDDLSTLLPEKFLLDVFVRGQFYTIYCFLFGLGFYLMLEKNNRLELNGNKLYIRRLAVMLLFGVIHCALWMGDVLHIYAIFGIPLIYFQKKKTAVIFRWAAGIFLGGILLDVIRTVFFLPAPPHSPELFSKETLHLINAYQHGPFTEILKIQYDKILKSIIAITRSTMTGYEHIIILFLLGLIAGKTRFFQRITELQPSIKRAILIILPFALVLKVISCLPTLNVHFLSPQQAVYEQLFLRMIRFTGILLMAFVYIGVITLLLHKSSSRIAFWLGNAGRLGLTNYLTQTIICMLLFYPFGLKLTGKLTLLQSLLLAVLIFIVQVIYSNIWLKYYNIGPMEAIWRRLTYGKQPDPATALQ